MAGKLHQIALVLDKFGLKDCIKCILHCKYCAFSTLICKQYSVLTVERDCTVSLYFAIMKFIIAQCSYISAGESQIETLCLIKETESRTV